MTLSLHLPFTVYHLPLINHCSLVIANSLKIDNCELIIEPTLGGVG